MHGGQRKPASANWYDEDEFGESKVAEDSVKNERERFTVGHGALTRTVKDAKRVLRSWVEKRSCTDHQC